MPRLIRLAAASVVVLVLLLVPAGPAHAHNGTMAFQGAFLAGPDSWSLSIPGSAGDVCLFAGPGAAVTTCGMAIDGTWSPVVGVPCGPSSGTTTAGGTDVIIMAVDAHSVQLSWVASAGNVLPMTGTHSGGGMGIVVMLVRLDPGCLAPVGMHWATGVGAFL